MDLFKKVLDTPVTGGNQTYEKLEIVQAAITLANLTGWRRWIFARAFNWRCRQYLKRYG